MEVENYIEELQQIAEKHFSKFSAELKEDGMASFLVVDSGIRGFEIYRDNDKVIVDSALDRTLQGELTFENYDQAIIKALAWING